MKKPGFTLIELTLVFSIITILMSLGISAYTKSYNRQIGASASEQLISILHANQNIASIGKKNCEGKYIGQRVTLSLPNIVQSQSLCDIANESPLPPPVVINGITFTSAHSLIFNPLSFGVDLETNPQIITFTGPTDVEYRISLNSSGTIEYLGVTQSP